MRSDSGFTVVEVLVTLIVGLLLLVAAHQLYSVVLSNGADARMRATASNIAYKYMREKTATLSSPCTASSSTIASTAFTDGGFTGVARPSGIVTVSCLASGTAIPTDISIVTATVTYGTPSKTVTHSTYVKTQ